MLKLCLLFYYPQNIKIYLQNIKIYPQNKLFQCPELKYKSFPILEFFCLQCSCMVWELFLGLNIYL